MYTMMTSEYNEIGVIHQSEHRLQPARIVRLSKQDKLTVIQIFEKTNNSCRNNSKSPCHFCLHIALYMYIRVLETVFKSRGFYLWTKLLPVGEISNNKTAILQTESAELTPPPNVLFSPTVTSLTDRFCGWGWRVLLFWTEQRGYWLWSLTDRC